MDTRHPNPSGHDDISQFDHQRHHQSTEQHLRTCVKQLPDDSHPFESRRDCSVWVDESTYLNDIDSPLPNHPSKSCNLSGHPEKEACLKQRIRLCSEAMQRKLQNVKPGRL